MPSKNDQPFKDDDRIREHLANERTFLAWLRSALSMMGLGIVIAKLKYFLGVTYPISYGILHASEIGLTFSFAGLVTIVLSAIAFLKNREQIRFGQYKSQSALVLCLAIVTIILGLIILWYLLQPLTVPK